MKYLRFNFFFNLILISALAVAQPKKELTLSDAVMNQYRELGPKKMRGLDWLNQSTYIYKKGKGLEEKLMAFDLKREKESELTSTSSLNQLLKSEGLDVKSLPSFTRVANDVLVFNIKGAYFRFDTKKVELQAFYNDSKGSSDVHFNSLGNKMAYVKSNNVWLNRLGEKAAEISHDGNENIVYGKAASRFEFGISEGIFWHESGDKLAYYRNDQTEVTDYPLIDLSSLPAKETPIKYPMAGGPTERVTLEIFSEDGSQIRLNTEPIDDAYLCSINWTPDGNQLLVVVLNRDQNKARYQRYNAYTGELIKTDFEESDDKYVEPLYPVIFTNTEGSDYVYLSQKDGWMHAYLRSGNEEVQLTKGEWVITKYLGINQDNSALYFEGTSENATENHIYKVDLNSNSFKRLSKNEGTYHAKLSPGGEYMITYFSSINTPYKAIIADAEGIVVKTLKSASDPLEEYKVSKPELLTITNSEGNVLHARMIKPSDFDEKKKYPALVYVYNGPHVQLVKNSWWAGASLWMNYMAEKGYIVFTVDGRGSYNRGKEFEQSVFRQLGELEIQDQLAGVKYLKSLSYIDPDRMAVHGWSYGGYMTTSLMLKEPGTFQVGVAGGPVTNWMYYEVMYTERYMDTPESNPEGFKNSDLTNYVQNLQGDLLLIHGLSDDVVVPQHNFTLIKKFVDEGIQIDFFPYPGHPHNVRGKDRVHLMEKVLNYIDDKLN